MAGTLSAAFDAEISSPTQESDTICRLYPHICPYAPDFCGFFGTNDFAIKGTKFPRKLCAPFLSSFLKLLFRRDFENLLFSLFWDFSLSYVCIIGSKY